MQIPFNLMFFPYTVKQVDKFRFIGLLSRCVVGGGALDAPHTMLRICLNAP